MNWLAFANPWMLAGLAAAGVPVLIHFLTRARPRRISFPPFKFLVEACAGQQSLHRLRTIVLMAIRCLAVLALVLLFAQPFLKPAISPAAAQAGKRVVIILDASLSMRAVQHGITLFARAQAEAAGVLKALDPGSEAAVILAGATPRPLLPALSRNLPALHDKLIKAQPTFENGNPAAALALARKMLDGPGTVYVFSDFQKTNWKNVRQLPGGIAYRLRPVTTAPVGNIALTSARLVPSEPVVGEPAQAFCTVFNCTPRPREETVQLDLGDFTRSTQVSVPAFGTADAVFNVTFPQAGPFAGKAWLPPDDLAEDNARFLAVRVQKALRILLISDVDTNDPRSAAFYISRALVPSPQVAPGLRLIRRRSQNVDRGVLERSDVFVLAPPAMLSDEAIAIISRRVKEGAGLMMFLDGAAAPPPMPSALAPPFQLQNMATSPAGIPVTIESPIIFDAGEADDFTSLRFYRHYRNQVLPNRKGDVALAYPDGSAALTLNAEGRGAVAFVNMAATPEGGNFVGSPMFPATLHELLRALRRSAAGRAPTPGSGWTLDVPTTGGGALSVVDPKGRPVAAQVIASGRNTRLALPPPRLPGVYAVKQAGTTIAWAVVNVDPRESDTRPIALARLKAGAGSTVATVRGNQDELPGNRPRPLWPQLAAATVALLALEMLLLAMWRRRVPGASGTANSIGRSTGHRTSNSQRQTQRTLEDANRNVHPGMETVR